MIIRHLHLVTGLLALSVIYGLLLYVGAVWFGWPIWLAVAASAGAILAVLGLVYATDREPTAPPVLQFVHWRLHDCHRGCEQPRATGIDTTDEALVSCPECLVALRLRDLGRRSP